MIVTKSVLVIGLGRFGKHIIEKLSDMDCEIMAVDRHEERVNDVLPLVTDAQIGDACNKMFLKSLGIDNYDYCFVAIGDNFEGSLIITAYLKELGARRVISRASSEVQRQFLLRNGADDVVYPEKQMAEWSAVRYTTEHVLDYIVLDKDYAIYEMRVPAEWTGRQVGDLDIRKRTNLNLLAVREGEKARIGVNSETVLNDNQTILVIGKWKDIQKYLKD